MAWDSVSPGIVKTEDEQRRDLCAVGRWLHERGYIVATDGNLSLRLDRDRVLTSPTAVSKGMMAPDDLVITDANGRKLSGRRNPSSELAMHLLIYKRRPKVHAICHAHPPVATGYAAAGLPLNKALLSEAVLALGCVPVAAYGTPGTPELVEALAPFVDRYDSVLMANHGVVTLGPDLLTAFFRMETTEHYARVALVTELLGKQLLLSGRDVEKLLAARARYGLAGGEIGPNCPVTAEAAEERRISLTREELEALIAEALRQDRERR
jgi:L-fuculose-phosphate aldolase